MQIEKKVICLPGLNGNSEQFHSPFCVMIGYLHHFYVFYHVHQF